MKSSLNLMSGRARNREQVRHCLRIWSRVLGGVVLVLAVWSFAAWRDCDQAAQGQASAELEYEPILQLQLESDRFRKEIEAIGSAERIPLELAKHQPLLSLIGLATLAVAEHDGSVYLQQIEIERDPLPEDSDSQPALMFSLEGSAVDSTAVTQLADSLRESGPFAAVEVSTTNASREAADAQQVFTIECTN